MTIIYWGILLAVTIFIHEYGHLWAMRRYGVEVKELVIGAPIPFLTLNTTLGKGKDRIAFRLSPILFIGWIRPTERGMERWQRLDTDKLLDIAGSGPLSNLVVSAFLIAGLVITKGQSQGSILLSGGFLASGLLMLAKPRLCTTRIFPVLGVLALGGMWWFLVAKLGADSASSGTSVLYFGDMSLAEAMRQIVAVFASINFALGLFNLMPLSFLDGGHQANALMKKWGFSAKFIKGYAVVSGVLLVVTIVLSHVV